MNSTIRLRVPITANIGTVLAALNDAMIAEQLQPPYVERLQEIVDTLFGTEPFRYSANITIDFPRGPLRLANAHPRSNAPPNLIQQMTSPIATNQRNMFEREPLQISNSFTPLGRRGRQFYLLNTAEPLPRGLRTRARLLVNSRGVTTHMASNRASNSAERVINNLNTSACTEPFQCAICLNTVDCAETIAILQCAHKFHRKCLLPWLQTNHSPSCPLCRAPIN